MPCFVSGWLAIIAAKPRPGSGRKSEGMNGEPCVLFAFSCPRLRFRCVPGKWRKDGMPGHQTGKEEGRKCPRVRPPLSPRHTHARNVLGCRARGPSKRHKHAPATFQCLNELNKDQTKDLLYPLRQWQRVAGGGWLDSPFMCKLWVQYYIDNESIKEMSLKLIGDILI